MLHANRRSRHHLEMTRGHTAHHSYMKSTGKCEEQELEYVHPSRDQLYGPSGQCERHRRHDDRAAHAQSTAAASYEKVGTFDRNTGRYLHIWEMPLPIPGEL